MTIPGNHARVVPEAYLIQGAWPRPMPEVAALGKSQVVIANGLPTGAIDLQEDLSLPGWTRWLANTANLVDSGTGFRDWISTIGPDAGAKWRFFAADAPLTDDTYSWKVPKTGKTRSFPAFILDKGRWAQLSGYPDHIAGFSSYIVAKIRGTGGAHYAPIFASLFTEADSDTSADTALQYWPGRVRTIKKGYSKFDSLTPTGRPQIILNYAAASSCYQRVGDTNWSATSFKHDHVAHYDMTWFLGRASGSFGSAYTLKADIIEIGIHNGAVSAATLRDTGYKLDALYRLVGK